MGSCFLGSRNANKGLDLTLRSMTSRFGKRLSSAVVTGLAYGSSLAINGGLHGVTQGNRLRS